MKLLIVLNNSFQLIISLIILKKTCIGIRNKRGHERSALLFHINIWNYYEIIQIDIACTNNMIEVDIMALICCSLIHIILWSFVDVLKKENNFMLNKHQLKKKI